MNRNVCLALSTFPDLETARSISEQLVTEKLAACANLVPGLESIYRWQGTVEKAAEVVGLFKTTVASYAAFQERLKSLHPYDVPEIICLEVENGFPPYLDWVRASCAGEFNG